jgi:hypothetical protein
MKYVPNRKLFNRKLFELFELFDKKVRNYSLFEKFLNPYLNPSLVVSHRLCPDIVFCYNMLYSPNAPLRCAFS